MPGDHRSWPLHCKQGEAVPVQYQESCFPHLPTEDILLTNIILAGHSILLPSGPLFTWGLKPFTPGSFLTCLVRQQTKHKGKPLILRIAVRHLGDSSSVQPSWVPKPCNIGPLFGIVLAPSRLLSLSSPRKICLPPLTVATHSRLWPLQVASSAT